VAYYEVAMLSNFDDVQKFGKDNVEATMRSFGAASKGFQAIAAEVTNYSKKSFEDGTAAVERLMGAKTLEKAIEVQSDYVKNAYEGFVAQATKLGELYADIAKETYKPFEGYIAKVTPTK
jgi:phasin family protein